MIKKGKVEKVNKIIMIIMIIIEKKKKKKLAHWKMPITQERNILLFAHNRTLTASSSVGYCYRSQLPFQPHLTASTANSLTYYTWEMVGTPTLAC